MNLRSILTRETVAVDLPGTTKNTIIEQLVDILVKAGKVTDRAAALKAVHEREDKMSTGMKHGIAIPHGKTDTVKDMVACIGVSRAPVEFDSLDKEPCRIFIMTISSSDKTGPHLQFLAEVSLLFKSGNKREKMLEAKSQDELLSIFLD